MYYILLDEDGEPFAIIDGDRYEEAEVAVDSIGGSVIETFEIEMHEKIYPVEGGAWPLWFQYHKKSGEILFGSRTRWEGIFGDEIETENDLIVYGQVVATNEKRAREKVLKLLNLKQGDKTCIIQ